MNGLQEWFDSLNLGWDSWKAQYRECLRTRLCSSSKKYNGWVDAQNTHTFLFFEFWNLFDIYYDKLKINLISFYFFPNWLPVIPPLLPHKTSASIQLCWKWKKLQFSFSNDWYPLLYTLKYNCELYSLNFPSIKCRTYVVYALANRDISLLWREGWTIGMK